MSNVKVKSSKECQISKLPYPSVTGPADLKRTEIIILFPLQGGRSGGGWGFAQINGRLGESDGRSLCFSRASSGQDPRHHTRDAGGRREAGFPARNFVNRCSAGSQRQEFC